MASGEYTCYHKHNITALLMGQRKTIMERGAILLLIHTKTVSTVYTRNLKQLKKCTYGKTAKKIVGKNTIK